MSDIIIVKNDEYFINSEDLAELSENEHRAVTQLIRNYTDELEHFGVLTFEMSKPNELGGRPKKTYLLNEHQATLLTTFMKNSKKVKEFKIKLVTEFFKMREYINSQKVTLAISKEMRKSLTDAVKDSGEQERMHNYGYSTYTLMIYKFLGLKKDYQDWKKETGGKGDYRKILSVEMRERIATAEGLVKGMLNLQKQHKEIKQTLEPLFKNKEIGNDSNSSN